MCRGFIYTRSPGVIMELRLFSCLREKREISTIRSRFAQYFRRVRLITRCTKGDRGKLAIGVGWRIAYVFTAFQQIAESSKWGGAKPWTRKLHFITNSSYEITAICWKTVEIQAMCHLTLTANLPRSPLFSKICTDSYPVLLANVVLYRCRLLV